MWIAQFFWRKGQLNEFSLRQSIVRKNSKICSIGVNKRKNERTKMPSLGYLSSFSSSLRAKERHLFTKEETNRTWIFKSEWDTYFFQTAFKVFSILYSNESLKSQKIIFHPTFLLNHLSLPLLYVRHTVLHIMLTIFINTCLNVNKWQVSLIKHIGNQRQGHIYK